jgi:hypothetical protein
MSIDLTDDLDLPDDLAEVPQDLLQKVLRKLPAYVRRQEPGAKLEVARAGPDGDHVRVYPGTDAYARAQRD